MKALVLKNRKLRLADCPVPKPSPDEALIKVLKAGICNTDIELGRGYMDFEGIPGHEFVGVVVEAREEKWQNERVVGEINLWCGECSFCRSGKPDHCERRSVLGIQKKDGAFAEYVTLPVKNLHVLPPSVSDTEGVFVEPLAAAIRILDQVKVSREDRVLVLGDGKLGLLIARTMRLSSDHVACVGRHERKLQLLHGQGIRTGLDVEDAGKGFDLIVEATGSVRGILDALNKVRPDGIIILKSTFQDQPILDLSRVVVDEITLVGSRCGPFDKAVGCLEKKQVSVADMVDKEYSLEEAVEAFEYAQRPGVIKVIINISETGKKKELNSKKDWY